MVRFTSLPFLISALARASAICHSDEDAVSSTCLDEGSSFVQLSKRSVKTGIQQDPQTGTEKIRGFVTDLLFKEGDNSSTVRPLNCRHFNKPLQVLETPYGYSVKELNITSGHYNQLFEVTFDMVPGKFQWLNGCGISPKDNKIYCVMFATAPFIVRLDASNIEFIVRMPWNEYTAGTFAPKGRFYASNINGYFLIVDDLDEAQGFPFSEAKGIDILDMRDTPLIRAPGFTQSADLVVLDGDLEGSGIVAEYIYCLYGPKLQIARYNSSESNFTKSWVLYVNPYHWGNVHGAGWEYAGKMYFAVNRGIGVYQVKYQDINFTETYDKDNQFPLILAGKSDPVARNDGMNCMNFPSPWVTNVLPFNCSSDMNRLIQAVGYDDGYDIAYLDIENGTHETIFSIPRNRTSPPFTEINAFGIGPMDYVGYATIVMDNVTNSSSPPPHYIVRFDEEKIEFVAKVQALSGKPIAGTFDAFGTYYVISNPSLLQFKGIQDMKGYTSWDHKDLPFYDMAQNKSIVVKEKLHGALNLADIIAVKANFDGEGKANWVVGVNAYQQLVTIKVSGSNSSKHLIFVTNDVHGYKKRQNFGAMWAVSGKALVASNDGKGIFEVDLSDVRLPYDGTPIQLTKVGESAAFASTDGMNCKPRGSPFEPAEDDDSLQTRRLRRT
mmetsp:Transcript_148132/g.258459  ORF Transcript_148132/g.258459 Transcript_148132/m.258459 type:complete len:665 (+) Transcript_148132:61-2055(+)